VAAGAAVKAVVRTRYGGPEVVELREVDRPEVADDGVLVKVRAASLNRADWYALAGPLVARSQMGVREPKEPALGGDFAGIVEAVGTDVADLRPGDEVYGTRSGALAEYVSVRKGVGPKPANLSFEEAAALPIAAVTALQAIRDKGRLQPGQRVLVNGAAGGVGHLAVQVAKALGAVELTAVTSTRNVELVRSLGADHVVDYTQEDFVRNGRRYDLVVDVAGGRPWGQLKRVLEPEGTLSIVGAPMSEGPLGPLPGIGMLWLRSRFGSRNAVFFIAKITRPDLAALRALVEDGKVKPVVERTYRLDEAAEAFRYLGTGHVQGKLVITT
jgi:NADPH:quinone reductase-like Zn-dependent oxidoreductase